RDRQANPTQSLPQTNKETPGMAAKFELKATKGGKFMFTLKAANGKVILTSETYDTKKAAAKGIEAVKKNAANEKRFEKRKTKNGQQYFILKAANGEPIGRSETCTSATSVKNGITSVMQNAPDARVDDLTE
ncbi:MAG: YegP family protein, partial [Nitrososphaera sp.]|nr:YegP family protein [Nitrososphaera sp.]